MLKIIKNYFDKVKELEFKNNSLTSENDELKLDLWEAEKKYTDPRYVIQKILEKKLEFFNSDELADPEARREYSKQIDDIKSNNAFYNEINTIIDSCIQYCAKESSNHEQTLGARMTINGLQLLKNRIEGFYAEKKEDETEEDIVHKIYRNNY